MRYVMARFENHQRELAYRIYITDCLRIMSENIAKASGGGSYMAVKYSDIVFKKKIKEQKEGEAKKSICKKLRVGDDG